MAIGEVLEMEVQRPKLTTTDIPQGTDESTLCQCLCTTKDNLFLLHAKFSILAENTEIGSVRSRLQCYNSFFFFLKSLLRAH